MDARLGWALAALLLCGEVAAILATDRLAAQPVAFAASLSTIAAAILVCFVATIYPSRQAARLDPAQALRYE